MILAIDYGESKCGLALGERLATKIWTVNRKQVFSEISKLKEIDFFVVGLPLSMSGRYSQQTFMAIQFAEKLHSKFKREVYMVDERLSSAVFKERKNVDQLSAAEILDRFLSSKTSSYKIRSPVLLSDEQLSEIADEKGNVLVADLSDVRVLKNRNWVVFQRDPYYAYLFYKRGCHVERDLKKLENFAPFDIIIAGDKCEEFKYLLSSTGRIMCL